MSIAPDPARLIDRLARLVAVNSENPPGDEAEVAALVAAELDALGFAVERRTVLPRRENVIGRFENGPGPVFAFNTHLDTVPAGEGWSRSPFALFRSEGRLYGRGACDAKGPLAAMIEACRMLIVERQAWSGTLLAVFVADEEAESRGAKAFAGERPRIDLAMVGEPTGNAVVVAHKGSLRPVVRVRGRTAHSGTPDLGINAILSAARLLDLVEADHRDRLRHRIHPLVGAASLTVTRIAGGIADNVVPDACELLLDRRLVPGESEADALAEIEALLRAAQERFGVGAEIVALKPTTGGATETPADHPLVRAATAAAMAHGVADPGPHGFGGACDLVHFRSTGAQGVVLGPGSLAVAHKPDEFVPADELIAASLIYRDTARAMLDGGGA